MVRERGGVRDDPLAASYEHCRALHREHGRSYYLATKLLPRWKRRHVHALYGFTRYTDDLVDESGTGPVERARRLHRWQLRFTAALHGAPVPDPVLPALLDTITRFDLDHADFTRFLHSMELDLTVTEYPTYDDLLDYMEGSAAAIGTMMLPILGSIDPAAAREPARQLGFAFQLTNFIRDVAEDADRGRIYLPGKDLADFGVTPHDLHLGVATGAVRRLIAFEVGRARWHYDRAARGIPLLEPASRPCIWAAYRLYGGILDEVEQAGYDVFVRRATVPRRRRLAIAAIAGLNRAAQA